MGGNALSEAVVFGSQAGKSAAHWAKRQGSDPMPGSTVQELANRKLEVMGGKVSARETLASIRKEIGDLLWDKVGILRNHDGLLRALATISSLERGLTSDVRVSRPRELVHYWELRNALVTAKCIAESALRRTESRGSHYRTDYPEQDDEGGLRSIEIRMRDEQLVVS